MAHLCSAHLSDAFRFLLGQGFTRRQKGIKTDGFEVVLKAHVFDPPPPILVGALFNLDGSAGPADEGAWVEEMSDLGRTMMATSACGLGMAAPNITESLMKYFPQRIADHLK